MTLRLLQRALYEYIENEGIIAVDTAMALNTIGIDTDDFHETAGEIVRRIERMNTYVH